MVRAVTVSITLSAAWAHLGEKIAVVAGVWLLVDFVIVAVVVFIVPVKIRAMQWRYDDLVDLARICARRAQTAETEEVGRTLRRMARGYLQQAAKLDRGIVPDIGLVCMKAEKARRAQPNQGETR
jgi:hypothetical protein